MTLQAAGTGRWMVFNDNGYNVGLITDKHAAMTALGKAPTDADRVFLCQTVCDDGTTVRFTSTNDTRYAVADAEAAIKFCSMLTADGARNELVRVAWFTEVR